MESLPGHSIEPNVYEAAPNARLLFASLRHQRSPVRRGRLGISAVDDLDALAKTKAHGPSEVYRAVLRASWQNGQDRTGR
jgi:hypothetical protein